MSFEVHDGKHVEDELTKIARHELRQTDEALATSAGRKFSGAVHDSRKRLKKVRALAALLEQAGAKLPHKDRKRLKAAARALSRIRDSAAVVDTLDRLRRRYPKRLPAHTYGVLRRSLVSARNRVEARARHNGVVGKARKRLAKTRQSAKAWTSPSMDVSDMVAVVVDSYRQSRQAMKRARARGLSATLHRWRKALKRLWYQLRLAQPLATGIAPLIADVKRLQTELGDDRNLVVLEATLRSCRDLRSKDAHIREISASCAAPMSVA